MAYSTIDKSTTNFNTKLYTGNGSTQSITGVGFQPDWVWIKNRTGTNWHTLYDAIRGTTKVLNSNENGAESTDATGLTSFDSDGFTHGSGGNGNVNNGSFVSWNWKAGGTSPAITYAVKVVSDSGNKYRFDDFGTSAVTLDLQEGGTYTFDQSDSSNSGHPLRFSTTSNGSHGGGSEYTTGVTTNGTPGSSGAYTRITVAASAPTLYYYCTNHSAMGGQANTNSTFGSSNFGGSIQSTVSANTTAGFSIVSYTGTGANATIGHGLGAVPRMIFVKSRDQSDSWLVQHGSLGAGKALNLDSTGAVQTYNPYWNATEPTTSVFSIGTDGRTNGSSETYIAYCFAEITGYSKFGSYIGTSANNAEAPFVYTGFRPSLVMIKNKEQASAWEMYDKSRDGFNPQVHGLRANAADTEDNSDDLLDLLSNGFKLRHQGSGINEVNDEFIYMAFGQSLVGSNNVPATAR